MSSTTERIRKLEEALRVATDRIALGEAEVTYVKDRVWVLAEKIELLREQSRP